MLPPKTVRSGVVSISSLLYVKACTSIQTKTQPTSGFAQLQQQATVIVKLLLYVRNVGQGLFVLVMACSAVLLLL